MRDSEHEGEVENDRLVSIKEREDSTCDGVNVMHFNIQGLKGKLQELERILVSENIDILCLSEHWEMDCMNDFSFGEYCVASCYNRTVTTRGGVAIIVKGNLEQKIIGCDDCAEKDYEICCARVSLGEEREVIVCAVYRAPSGNFKKFMECLEKTIGALRLGSRCTLVVAGDFNVELRPHRDGETLKNFLRESNAVQTAFEPTRRTRNSQTCIDNIFTSAECRVARVCDSPLSDHTYQVIKLDLNILQHTLTQPLHLACRQFNQHNISYFRNQLDTVNWRSILDNEAADADELFQRFFDVFLEHFNDAFPIVTINKSSYRPKPYGRFSPELLNLSKLVREMSINSRTTNCENYRTRYKIVRKVYLDRLEREKKTYNDKRVTNAWNVNRECWAIVNECRRGGKEYNRITEVVDREGKTIHNSSEVCEVFNSYFMNLADNSIKPSDRNSYTRENKAQQSMFLSPTSPDEIEKTVRRVCKKKRAAWTRYRVTSL